MANAIHVIAPYWSHGTWVFDDPARGLSAEPFVSGVPEMIDDLVRDIPGARAGFRLLFSPTPFPGFQRAFALVREEFGGQLVPLRRLAGRGLALSGAVQVFRRGPQDDLREGGAARNVSHRMSVVACSPAGTPVGSFCISA
jgi:hypothetical protein